MAQLAQISMVTGPPTVRDERGSLSGIVFVDVTGRDLAGYVAEAQRVVREQVRLKPGYRLEWGDSSNIWSGPRPASGSWCR